LFSPKNVLFTKTRNQKTFYALVAEITLKRWQYPPPFSKSKNKCRHLIIKIDKEKFIRKLFNLLMMALQVASPQLIINICGVKLFFDTLIYAGDKERATRRGE
jgi:hypothetical protein